MLTLFFFQNLGLDLKRYFGSLIGIMQAINRLFSQNCNCYPHLFRCSTIKIHNFSTSVETFCCLAFITFQYIVQFSRCNLLFWAFQLDHWEKDYMSRFARHWIALSLWSQISKPNFLGSEIQQQIGFGGPEWARTTDLTIISRTL